MQGSWLSFYAALQNDLPLFLLNNLKKKKDEELHHVGVPLPRQMVSLPETGLSIWAEAGLSIWAEAGLSIWAEAGLSIWAEAGLSIWAEARHLHMKLFK